MDGRKVQGPRSTATVADVAHAPYFLTAANRTQSSNPLVKQTPDEDPTRVGTAGNPQDRL